MTQIRAKRQQIPIGQKIKQNDKEENDKKSKCKIQSSNDKKDKMTTKSKCQQN